MPGLVHDVRLAVRSFARRPGFLAVAVARLAFALGANAAVVSLVDAPWWRPFGVERPETLVDLRSMDPDLPLYDARLDPAEALPIE